MTRNILNYLTLTVTTMCFSLSIYADTVWVDVRSTVEHKIDNIEGDFRVSHSNIVQEINILHPDKDTKIRLYCRSGGRAEKALSALKEAGYTDVLNKGSIGNARKERGLSQ